MDPVENSLMEFVRDARIPVSLSEIQDHFRARRVRTSRTNTLELLENLVQDGALVVQGTIGSDSELYSLPAPTPMQVPEWQEPASEEASPRTMADFIEEAPAATPSAPLPTTDVFDMVPTGEQILLPELPEEALPLEEAFKAVNQVGAIANELGIELPEFNMANTHVLIRQSVQRSFQEWLRTGALLYQARLYTSRAEFAEWVARCGIPMSERSIQKAISGFRAIQEIPECRKLASGMSSIKKFQVVQRVLTVPGALEVYRSTGKILDMTPAELDSASKTTLEALEKEMRRKGEEASAKIAALETAVAAKDEELGKVHRELSLRTNPELSEAALSKAFLAEIGQLIDAAYPRLAQLQVGRRTDLNSLQPTAISRGYVALIGLSKTLSLVLREFEARWGKQVPELLLDEDGQMRMPVTRQELRILARDAQEADIGGQAALKGQQVLVFRRDEQVAEIAD
jgi:hypothetical protein